MSSPFRLGLLSDFNLQNLAALLLKVSDGTAWEIIQADYGQAVQTIMNQGSDFWRGEPDAVCLWTLPQNAATGLQRVLSFEEFPVEALLAEVDEFGALVERASQRVALVILPSWVVPDVERGLGPTAYLLGRTIPYTALLIVALPSLFGLLWRLRAHPAQTLGQSPLEVSALVLIVTLTLVYSVFGAYMSRYRLPVELVLLVFASRAVASVTTFATWSGCPAGAA